MSIEELAMESMSFDVVDEDGVRSTLELVHTFRLTVEGSERDYCIVRSLSPEGEEPLGEDDGIFLEALDPDEGDGEVLSAFRLEPDGLVSLDPGEETLLLWQAMFSLMRLSEFPSLTADRAQMD